ncbi:MAG: bifunctional nicotinamidase/pyrazinamidase [Thermoproteota archaeon]
MKFTIDKDDALVVVDIQKDFLPGGALPVPEGDEIIPKMNTYIEKFEQAGAKIYATRDWHPPNHKSFKSQGGIWPPHCVQNSEGAGFHPDLELPEETDIISVGYKPSLEGYSAFEGTNLGQKLEEDGINRLFVGGLATDYCVKHTVIDALKIGMETIVLTDASRGVNKEPNDAQKAIEEMRKTGTEEATLADIR